MINCIVKKAITASCLFLTLLTFVNQGFAMQSTTSEKITLISPEEAQDYIENTKDFFLLDVRTQAEHDEKSIAGSNLIPLQELNERLNEIPKDKEILVHCRSGKRAQKAAKIIAPTLTDTAKIYVIDGAFIPTLVPNN